ncbi:ABC transporter substrate-binding protein [Leptolyngbya sp. GGD]|uniref:ABC transporter substrate-binding protein n=1 Tax=Leptolyngbya sp. GGD TaxID=2997907 RepID=UPI00227B658C|nr:ABC transporter substrate-binding protein [Leptolyngbya sp. GGD]MCY6494569.1 ABC transporter substrate-binding protein [Leptolyngbya sp. GGD]
MKKVIQPWFVTSFLTSKSLKPITATTILCLMSACNFTSRSASEKSLKIGALLPLTGEISAYGIPMQKTAKLLVDTVNQCEGVLGSPVTLVNADDQSEPQIGAEAMSRLVQVDRVSAVIGGAGSATSAASVDIAVRNQVVMISPSSTSPTFTERAKKGDFKGFWYRTAPPDTFQAPAIAQLAYQNNYKRIAILGVNNDYGKGLIDAFIPAFEKKGGQVLNKANLALYALNASNFDSEVRNAFGKNPDAVLLIDYSQTGGQVLKSSYEQGFLEKIPVILSDGLKDAKLAERVGKKADGQLALSTAASLIGTVPSSRGPAFSAFRTRYQQAFSNQEPSIYDPNTWDAAAIIVLATELAKSTKGEAIRDQIPQVSNPAGEKVSDVCQALSLIRQGKKIDYEGASSSVNFDAQGDVQGSYNVWTIAKDGTIQIKGNIQADRFDSAKP